MTSSAFMPFPATIEETSASATIVFATQYFRLKQPPLRQRKRQSTRFLVRERSQRTSCCPRGEMAGKLDITVINPLCPSYISRASRVAGAAAEARHWEKMSKHFDDCEEAGMDFFPLTVETLGGWEPDALLHLQRIGHLSAQRLGSPPSTSVKHLVQRLSIV
jgi:hypothetical protein